LSASMFMQKSWLEEALIAYTRIVLTPKAAIRGMSRVHPAWSARGSVNLPVDEVEPFVLTSCWYAIPLMKNSVPFS
jgi:hypothetical protein